MLTPTRYICALLLFLSALAPSVTLAQSKAARAAAREAYGRGQQLFAKDDFEKARAAFEEAFAAVPNPIVLRSIAECEAKLGHTQAAIESFERYLEEKPDASDRGDVEGRLVELRKQPAILVVRSSPAGAVVTLDGAPSGSVTPAEVEVAAGEHKVEVAADGYDSGHRNVTANPGERVELDITLMELPEAAPAVASAEPAVGIEPYEEHEGDGDSNVAIWVTGGIGVAGIVAGSVLGAMAISKQGDFEDAPTEDAADEGEQLALFADVGFGVGAIGLITCAVLLLIDDDGEETALQIQPVLSPTQAGVGASMKF